MKRKLTRDLSANALQLILNQVFGLVIFYILSTTLTKAGFGQINLVLAILLAAFNILSMGIDQLIIKKVASGGDVPGTLSLYLFHVVLAGLLFYGALLLGKALFPQTTNTYSLLLLIGIGKLLIFFSTPFKQVANGLERFRLLAYMLIGSNLVRSMALLVLALLHTVTIPVIVIIFITGDAVELLASVLLFRYGIKSQVTIRWDKADYGAILKEALPQSGVVVITSALARFDWIYIGFTLSAVKLAEYSFAYKVFEISTLPLLAIAPLLIPRFTKLFKPGNKEAKDLGLLIRSEIVVAVLVTLALNVCWAPVIDAVTAGKYGAVNITTIFILSLCMPLLYVNNFLWTIYFAQGRLKMILTAFIITLIVNVAGDVALIPIYGNEGAAFAFLLACGAQTVFFLLKNDIQALKAMPYNLAICTICALTAGLSVRYFVPQMWLALPASVLVYATLLAVAKQVRPGERKALADLLHW